MMAEAEKDPTKPVIKGMFEEYMKYDWLKHYYEDEK